jgi:hypothetical protein
MGGRIGMLERLLVFLIAVFLLLIATRAILRVLVG